MPISLIPQSNSVSIPNAFTGPSWGRPNYPYLCALYGNYLYVAWNDRSELTKDISIYDISNPSDPSLKATITPTEIEPPIMALSINNGRMMVGVAKDSIAGAGYYVYDLTSNPLVPQYITEFHGFGTYDISSVVSNNNFYFCSYEGGVSIQSVSSPAEFQLLDLGCRIQCIVVQNIGSSTYLFCSSYIGIFVLLVNEGVSLTNLGQFNVSSLYRNLTIKNNYIFAERHSAGAVAIVAIDIFDVNNPRSINLISSIGESCVAMIQNETALALASNLASSPIYNVSNPKYPVEQINIANIPAIPLIYGGSWWGFTDLGCQNCVAVDSNNYVYVCNSYNLHTYYLYSSEVATTTTTTPILTLADRPIQLKSVQTVLVTRDSRTIADDASDNKGTLNTIDAQSLSFGPLAAGETSETKIIYLNVPNAVAIRNIKVGLVDTGSVVFSTNSFGVETREILDYNIVPSSYFAGLNTDNLPTNVYNISVENAGENYSQYVYINIKVPDNQAVGDGIVKLVWFFDYA